MLFTEKAARENIRNREGKRVFYLGKGDQLTSDARDFLNRERIEILPAHLAKPDRYRLESGGYMDEKPEHMTHLQGDMLVPKTHPRIAFRGAVDSLEAELLLCQLAVPEQKTELGEMLSAVRGVIRCDVLDEPVQEEKLCGLTPKEIREQSHRPQDFYGVPHFMPDVSDGEKILRINRVRAMARRAELAAVCAFGTDREDILRLMNRMSSMLYLLMIRLKAQTSRRGGS